MVKEAIIFMAQQKKFDSKKDFQLENILTDIESSMREKDFYKKTEIFLIKLIKKGNNEIYKQDSDDKSKVILFESLKKEMQKSAFKDREIIDYDIVNKKRNTHELVIVSDYDNISNELNGFNDENLSLTSTKDLSERDFDLYMLSINTYNNNYKIFGSFSGVYKLKKKYLLGHYVEYGNFQDSKINFSKKDNIIGFNKKIDMFVVNDKFLLINQAQTKFDNLFKMEQYFSEKAIDILNGENNDITKYIKMVFNEETRKNLIEKVKVSKTMATKLIKITSDKVRFKKTVNNIGEIEKYLPDENGKVMIKNDFSNKIKDVKYKNKQLSVEKGKEMQLLIAISDSFYEAVISKTQNIDKSRI